ncbi:MAG TPA: hypothetical protein VHN37_04980 [Actinomycetota bacterium]|nr:hypothetical protein [Actinomycetota bacterium]
MKASSTPVKVSEQTRDRLRIAAAIKGCSQAEIVDAAVDEYIARHAEDFAMGLKKARDALFTGRESAIAYLLDEDEAAVRRVSGTTPPEAR